MKCSGCKKEVDPLEIFPGKRCLSCHAADRHAVEVTEEARGTDEILDSREIREVK